MKSIVISLIGVFTMIQASSQVRDHRRPADRKPPVTTTVSGSNKLIVLYDLPGYGGTHKSFGAGSYRFSSPADLNDVASSVKVPPGMAVILYEHANEKGGYGNSVDLLEDCADLTVYNFSDKVSYITVFATTDARGYVWARNKVRDGRFVTGHWERKRADGKLPDNTPPAAVLTPALADPDDVASAPVATQAEINEFNDIMQNQLGVAVLGGETTKPFYYHHNQPGEAVYKYNKIIDPARLPGGFFDWAANKLGWAGIVVRPFEAVTDIAGDIKDWIFGSSSTKMEMDCWYPVSEFRTTVCGTLTSDASICTQDYLHTQVTIDKDVCYHISPFEKFRPVLTNRWTGETSSSIEGEVKSVNLANFNTQTQKWVETTQPRNPLLMEFKKDQQACLYGPWMGDILDINLKVPIPLTDSKIEITNIDLRKNNEIHPINQMWRKNGDEWQLTAIADGTGYFQKTGNGEVAASGLYQRMRFYIAFTLPATFRPGMGIQMREYHINGAGFEFTSNPPRDVQPETITLKNNGTVRLKINNNSFSRVQRTHKVFFDKVRKRQDGSVQGYIVVETEPINKQGGSVNIFVKEVTVDSGPVAPGRPVIRSGE